MTTTGSPRTRRAPVRGLPPESELDFQHRVMELAKLSGWMVVHYRPARVGKGPRTRVVTPLSGDRGAPDLILARDGVVLLVELKAQNGRLSPEQRQWLHHIGEHGRVWRPSDWLTVVQELSRTAIKRRSTAVL